MKFVGKWIDVVKIKSSELTQTQKDKYHFFTLISGS